MSLSVKLDKDLVAASSAPLVLAVLAEGESYGYAIIQRVKELSGGEIEWSDGMLYPVLHWLENQKWTSSRWGESDTGRKRKYYSLTDKGRKAMKEQRDQWNIVNRTLVQLWRPHYA